MKKKHKKALPVPSAQVADNNGIPTIGKPSSDYNAPVSPRTESSDREANVSKADGAFVDFTIPQTE